MNRIYVSNCIFAFRYTNGFDYLFDFVFEDNGKFRFVYPCIYELHNLVKQRSGIEEANKLIFEINSSIYEGGIYPSEFLLPSDKPKLEQALQLAVPENPISNKSKKFAPNLLDITIAIVADRLKVDFISTDKRLVNFVNSNSRFFGIKGVYPYPENFVELGRAEFQPDNPLNPEDSDQFVSNEFLKFVSLLNSKKVDQDKIQSISREFYRNFPEN